MSIDLSIVQISIPHPEEEPLQSSQYGHEGERARTFSFIVDANTPVKCSPRGINIKMSQIFLRDGS